MSATSFTILPDSFVQVNQSPLPRSSLLHSTFELQYIVREANESEIKVVIVWDTKFGGRRAAYPQTVLTSTMLVRTTTAEKQYRGISLNAAELESFKDGRFEPNFSFRSRVLIKDPAPTPAPAPVISPAAIASTMETLQTQITKLTADVATLGTQLQNTTAENTTLTQLLQTTQVQLDKITASLRVALSK